MDQQNIEQHRQESRSEWPFFAFVTLVMIFIYGIVVVQILDPRDDPTEFVLFTVLMVVHTALYWLPLLFPFNTKQGLIYLSVQTILAYTLILIAGSPFLTFGLVAPLIGLSLGMLPGRATAVFIVIVLAISAGVMVFFEGWTSVSGWLLLAIPITIFIIIYVVLYGRQAAAKEQAQKLLVELEHANAELADYAEQVEELTLAAERQRMARELHDTLAQGVAGLVLQLEAVDAHLDNGDAQRAQTIVQQAMVRARGTLADARRAIDDLRKGQEDGRDLSNIMREKTDRFTISTNITCHLDLDIPPTLSETLYEPTVRTVTEALANIAKHASATEVWVSLKVKNQALAVEVRDNGVGFEPSGPIAAGHYGLQGMQERAELADGSVDIISQPGDGTTVRLLLPLDTALPISDP